MKTGQASLAIGLFVMFIAIICVIVIVVFSLDQQDYVAPTYTVTDSWCNPGESEYYEGILITIEGMATFDGYQLCKASLDYYGETAYLYSNEDATLLYITDASGNILEYYSEPSGATTPDVPPGGVSGPSEVCLEHGELMDFVNGVKYDNEDNYQDTDLEETPFSADQGMAGGAGLRSPNWLGITNVGVKELSSVTMDDVYAGAMDSNPTAVVGNTYAVELRNSEYAVLKVTDVSQDMMTVCFEWAMLGETAAAGTNVLEPSVDCACDGTEVDLGWCYSADSMGDYHICGVVEKGGENVCRTVISDGIYSLVAYERQMTSQVQQLVYYEDCDGNPLSYSDAMALLELMGEGSSQLADGSQQDTGQQDGAQQDGSCIGGQCACDGVSVENCVNGERLNAMFLQGYYCGEVTYKGQKMCKVSLFVTDETTICGYFSPIVESWYSEPGVEAYFTYAGGGEITDHDVFADVYCGDRNNIPFE